MSGLPKDKSLEKIWPEDEVDLSLRYLMGNNKLENLQKEVIERIDQWCTDYKACIRKLGGIGFFLSGIGPDSHIGFNVRGSNLYSTTGLAAINYKTQAAATAELDGIEIAKKRLVITIGLSTITYNPDCAAIIIAAGEAKAGIVAEFIQNKPHIRYPATVLQELKASSFHLTKGSAKLLTGRQQEFFVQSERISETQIEKTIIDLSLEKQKRIDLLRSMIFKAILFQKHC